MKAPIEYSKGRPWVIRLGRVFVRNIYRLAQVPVIRKWHPWLDDAATDMRYLPINRNIEKPDETPLPPILIERFIDEASRRVIIDYCGCRHGKRCRNYPIEIGCLFLGEAAPHVAPSISREVTADEARDHLHKAISAGLVPAVGTARVDNIVFRVTNPRKLLTICFCCECCCLGRFNRYVPLPYLEATFPRLKGVEVTVNGNCTGCGVCVEHCYVNAIRIEDGRAVHSARCRACGRCATFCPQDAVSIRITDAAVLETTYQRIGSYVSHV